MSYQPPAQTVALFTPDAYQVLDCESKVGPVLLHLVKIHSQYTLLTKPFCPNQITEPTMAVSQASGRSRYTSPPQSQSSTTTTTILPRQSIQVYGSNSANTSPTSTYQSPQQGNQTSNGSNQGSSLNPFFSHHIPRQLHPPKSPLYRPAVLRTTERTSRPSTSNGGSATPCHQSSPPSSSLSAEAKECSTGLAIFGGADILSGVFGAANLGAVPEWDESVNKHVSGPPHREHWKVKSISNSCGHLCHTDDLEG